MNNKIHIGTSGWSYPHWNSCFYADVTKNNWLTHYATQFSTVEINASFYRLQSAETFQKWCDLTPEHFRFSLKANRYLTHTKRLNDPLDSVLIEKQHAQYLQPKLACVLWQLPKNLSKNMLKLDNFIDALMHWQEVNHAIEFRHASWFDDETAKLLASHKTVPCVSDAADWPMWLIINSDLLYIRLHGHTHTYSSRYTKSQLQQWADRIKHHNNAWIYFDNDAECAAVENALELQKLIRSFH